MEQEELITRIKKALAKQPVRLAYLYGSYAKGKTHPKSDIDIAVVPERGVKMFGFEIAGKIRDALGEDAPDVDVHAIDLKTEPVFLANVLKPARPMFARSEKERIRFETNAWRQFYDTQHLRDIIYYHMYKRIKEDTYGRRTPHYQKTA